MFGLFVWKLLAIAAVFNQVFDVTDARPSLYSGQRNTNTNLNINAQVNPSQRKYRRAQAADDEIRQKENADKIIETAAVATAAADAAKTVTRMLAQKLSESTASAVADAVVRVLTENASEPVQNVAKVATRAAIAAAQRKDSDTSTSANVMANRLDGTTPSSDNSTPIPADSGNAGKSRLNDSEKKDENSDVDDDDTSDKPLNSRYYNYGLPWESRYDYRRSMLDSMDIPESRFY